MARYFVVGVMERSRSPMGRWTMLVSQNQRMEQCAWGSKQVITTPSRELSMRFSPTLD
jgi:hypothetical protein